MNRALAHLRPAWLRLPPAWPCALRTVLLLALLAPGWPARAVAQSVTPAAAIAGALPAPLAEDVRRMVLDHVAAPRGARVEVQLGELDARLRLAPCDRIEPFVPPGTRLWGQARVGLRCMAGAVAWKVYLPVNVKVYGQALVAVGPLRAGAELTVLDLRYAEVDLAQQGGTTFTDAAKVAGRVLARALAPGEPLRHELLRARQWFSAGETVVLTAAGAGFAVSGEGQALGPGLEGRMVRVRTASGRVVTGVPVGERKVQVGL